MAFNLGDIFVTFKAKTEDLQAGVGKVKSLTAQAEQTVNRTSFKAFATNASSSFGSVANSIQSVVTKAAIFATASSVGIGTFIKSAADLQQTSKSFEVLTGNVDVANKLFAQLARYANTTPFEFPQIAKAGQILLGFGIKSGEVYERIQMLGDIAAATGADFTSLALVFGQVNATGRLMGQDALQLINNKIPITSILAKRLGLSVQEVKEQMELGKISADDFNAALTATTKKGGFAFKGTTVLAQSLNGRLSTLKDTVLEFGRNLVGVKVDPKLGLVIKPGGLFDRFSQLVPKITDSLSKMAPKAEAAVAFLLDHGEEVKAAIIGIAAAFVFAKVAAIGFAIAASPFSVLAIAIAAGVTLLVGTLVALQVRFNWVGKAIDGVQRAGELLTGWFRTARDHAASFGKEVAGVADGALTWIKDRIDDVAGAFQAVIGWVEKHKKGLQDLATFLGLLFGPLLIKLGVQALVVGAQMAAAALMAGAAWVAHAVAAGAAWTVQFAIMSAKAIATGAVNAAQAIVSGVAWSVQAGIAGARWIAQFVLMSAKAVATGAIMVATAVKAGIAWVVALGPVAIAIGVVAALAYVLIRNWDTVKRWFSGLWSWMKDAVASVGRGISGAFSAAAGTLLAPYRMAFNAIARFWNNTVGRLSFKAPDWVPGIGGKGWSMPQLPTFARGVENYSGGWAIVGEAGPELAYLPKGSDVYSNRKSKGMMGSNTTIYGDVNIGSEVDANGFLRRLTRDQELEGMGLSPATT